MPLKRVVATITVLIGLLLAATLWSVGCDAEPAASTAAEPTTQVAPSEPRDALTGPFPSDLSDPEAVVHSRTVVEREGQPDVTFDFWWQEATGCYRVERRFGSSSVLSEAQVFDGARLAGFVATGHDRHAFDMSYEQSQELNEVMDPRLVAGTEAQRLEAVSGLIERGAIAESGSEACEGRPVVRYRGTVEGTLEETLEGTAGNGQGSSSAEAVHELLIDEATRLVIEERLQQGDSLLFHAARDYEVVPSSDTGQLMDLTIPPGYGPATAGGAAAGTILVALGPGACELALTDLTEWLPTAPYYLGSEFAAPEDRRLVIRDVQTTQPDEVGPVLLFGLETFGGLAGGPARAPTGCTVRYLTDEQDGTSLSVAVQYPEFTPEGAGFPLAHWKKVEGVQVAVPGDDLYSVGSGYIYLARRADAVVALISNLSQKDILAAGAALRPFSSVTSRRSSPWAQAAPRR